ncbi:hypothetical protein A3Q56_01867 [Intoshia linei]|uniref:Anoctamin n=1 Tax=Intoshia linei TaxID=1819745 RepID=A0A177B7Y6_9BILA|nr:hypothetical protein A3Q56_01867 [Intoshia linei]
MGKHAAQAFTGIIHFTQCKYSHFTLIKFTKDTQNNSLNLDNLLVLKTTRNNPVTNEATKYTPFKIQCSKYLASVMVLLFMNKKISWSEFLNPEMSQKRICILFIITANIIVYRIFTNIRYCSDISKLSCLFVSNIVSSLANTIAIVAFGAVYNILAVKLTDWENHQTETNYNNALIIKLFSFHFINSYTTPFYIAFFRNIKFENGVFGLGGEYQDTCDKECMQMLTIQIFFLMIGKAFPKFFTDVVLPVLKRIKQRGFFNKVVRVALDKSIYMEREYIKPQLTDFTLSEYNEKIILYGFVMIFAASIPIGPLIALIVIYADIKVDASRLLWIYRRPVADISQNIGIWQGILELLNVIGVISNAFLIAYTSKDYLNSTERKMIFVVIFEHALFTIKFLAAYAIPDVPKQIAIAIRRVI